MKTQTIVIKKFDNISGSYDYVEFSMETKQYATGNSGHHWGHGRPFLEIGIDSKKRLREYIDTLKAEGYEEIETFEHRPNYKGAK